MSKKESHKEIRHRVKLPDFIQDIYVGNNLLDLFALEFKKLGYKQSIVLVDPRIRASHDGYFSKIVSIVKPQCIVSVPADETSKSLQFLDSVLLKCYKTTVTRKGCFIGIGGGIVGDVTGFLASVYMRGIDFIFIPTTLMAQGDTIVNKVGISYRLLKNILGSFYSPVLTICDTDFLATLTKKEISLGLSEIIKHALIGSEDFFQYLENNIGDINDWPIFPWKDIISQSIKIKIGLVQKDPWDTKGLHKGLSYGHTLANVLEGLSHYQLRHGDAVSIGMSIAAMVSNRMGYLAAEALERQNQLLRRCALPTRMRRRIDFEEAQHLLRRDKIAQNGHIQLVLLKRIGSFTLKRNVDAYEIVRAWRSL